MTDKQFTSGQRVGSLFPVKFPLDLFTRTLQNRTLTVIKITIGIEKERAFWF